ncbi:MAG: serine/threonine-protein kinase, partial [Planctomycetota bacterium]
MSAGPRLPSSGEVFAGHAVIRQIGEGSRGVVYEVRSKGGVTVALKLLKPELASNPDAVGEFEAEAVATGSVRNKAVIEIYRHGVEHGLPYILMEFVDGASLDRLLERRRRLTWRAAVRIAIQVASALGHAHGTGLIHRDVKPGNVLLYRDGTPRLTDFGIVKDIGTLKGYLLEGRRVGTSAYASPEQCLGKRLDPATDMYSLGATLFHMVCGRPPFTGDTPNEIMNKHVKAKLPSPMQL